MGYWLYRETLISPIQMAIPSQKTSRKYEWRYPAPLKSLHLCISARCSASLPFFAYAPLQVTRQSNWRKALPLTRQLQWRKPLAISLVAVKEKPRVRSRVVSPAPVTRYFMHGWVLLNKETPSDISFKRNLYQEIVCKTNPIRSICKALKHYFILIACAVVQVRIFFWYSRLQYSTSIFASVFFILLNISVYSYAGYTFFFDSHACWMNFH